MRFLQQSKIDAMITTRRTGNQAIYQNAIQNVFALPITLLNTPAGIAVEKGNSELLETLNRAITELQKNGEIDRILSDWESTRILVFTKQDVWAITALTAGGVSIFFLGVGILYFRQRRLVFARLSESESRYRSLVEQSPDATVITVGEAIVFANKAAAELAGAELPDQLVGERYMDFFRADFRDLAAKQSRRLLAEKGAMPVAEATIVRLDGSEFDAELTAAPVTWQGARAIQTILRDITERKRAEKDLKRLFHAVEHSPATIIITDAEAKIEYVNKAFVDITGYSTDEVIGENPRFLKSGHTPPEEHTRLWKTITSGEVWRGEFHNKRKDGSLFVESASISPLTDSQGTITSFVAVKEDITERKQIEEQLAQAKDGSSGTTHRRRGP